MSTIDYNALFSYAINPRSVATPVDYREHLKIINKAGLIVPFVPNRVQRHYYANRGRRNLILKARQVGVSTGIQASMANEVWTQTALQITLAHDSDTTLKLRRMAKRFYDYLPSDLQPAMQMDNVKTSVYTSTGSEATIATAGNISAGIGGTYTRVHGSEVSRWKDAYAITSGLLQGVPADGLIEYESTANGAQGEFYELCMEALDGNTDWTFFFYPWFWADEYRLALEPGEVLAYTDEETELVRFHGLDDEQINWRRAKRKQLPLTFFQEYPESPIQAFILSGNSVFGDIIHNLNAPKDAKPVEGHRYVAGGDWGQTEDYSALSIIDATTDTEVYLDRWNKMDWDDMQWRMVDKCIYWGVETFQPEKNSIGSVNIRYLREKFESRGFDITLRPITTDNRKKQRWVANFYNALHNQETPLQLLNIDYATAELNAFTQKQTPQGAYTYAASAGHDDTVLARLICYDAACKVIS